MAMRAYLCASDRETLYPDAEEVTVVGEASYHLPFLWLALFRPRDLQVPTSEEPGDTTLLDPLTERETALRQLDAAGPILKAMFQDLGPMDGYCDWLYRAIARQLHRYIYLETTEIGWDDDTHQAHLRYATGVFEQRVPMAVGRKSLLHLSSYEDTLPFPPLCLHADSPRDLWIAQSKIVGNLEIAPPSISR